jgi:hypothetical protein
MSLPPYDQSVRNFEQHFQVVLPDSVGQATIGFRDGVWYRLNSGAPHVVPIRSAIILCPHAAGSIVQIACWWMRENARTPRALDLATELALTVGELARKAIEDDPLGMSMTTLPPGPQIASSVSSSSFGAPALGVGSGSPLDGNPYDSGSYGTNPYPATPAPAPAPYEPAYAAATTMIPQVTADGPGYPTGNLPRPGGPAPGLPALPPPSPGRPGPAGPAGFGAPRGQGAPAGRPPMGQHAGPSAASNSGNWDRPNGFDPRSGRAAAPPRQPSGYEADPRDEFFRSSGAQQQPQPQRRPERDEYPTGGRPPISRPAPRPDAGRSW